MEREKNQRTRNPFLEHEKLMDRGLELHEARKYRQALPFFERAHRAWPACPSVVYNIANTSYMLGRYDEASTLLRGLAGSRNSLRSGCALMTRGDVHSLEADLRFLLFLVTVHWRGPTGQALRYAEAHLRLRARGRKSIWSIREVRARIDGAKKRRREMKTIAPIVI